MSQIFGRSVPNTEMEQGLASEVNVTKTARYWCFTWNNYTEDSLMRLRGSDYTLLCVGKEVASSGTKHLQGVIGLTSPQRMSKLKKLFGSSPHWEICRNLEASIKYCMKEGDYFFEDRRRRRGPRSADPTKVDREHINGEVDVVFKNIVSRIRTRL